MGKQQAPDFQFITSINTVTRDDDTRRKVRSHARRQKLPNESSPPQPRKLATQKERISKFRLKSAAKPSRVLSTVNPAAEGLPPDDSKDRQALIVNSPTTTKVEARDSEDPFQPTMLSNELAMVVARELPSFPMLQIETTPLTEKLLKYCFTVCLCPREALVEKWFNKCGAPIYMMTCKCPGASLALLCLISPD